MYSSRNYKNRNPEQILSEDLYFDSVGHVYRAVSWLDYFERTNLFSSLMYSCIEARMGIEHLMFEELVLSTGFRLDRDDYEKCLRSRLKFKKLIRTLNPHYEKLKEFTCVVLELLNVDTRGRTSQIVFWKIQELEKLWGKLSIHLHWTGASSETTDGPDWVNNTYEEIRDTVRLLWERMCLGPTGILHYRDMNPHVRDIWTDYSNDKIDIDSVRRRLLLVSPPL